VRLFSQGPPNAFHDSQKDLAVSAHYPRDMIGYGATPPHPHWPGEARIALSFVLNYEEGGERNILHGDPESEAFLSEMVAAQPLPGARNMSMESLYEYGSRAGVWRILDLFKTCGIPLTVFAVAMAAQRHPEVIRAMVAAGVPAPTPDAWSWRKAAFSTIRTAMTTTCPTGPPMLPWTSRTW
jgi:peptidoglycan/xylan/chitin deacetylase (PgdA/CDA1 family)